MQQRSTWCSCPTQMCDCDCAAVQAVKGGAVAEEGESTEPDEPRDKAQT